MAVMCPLRLYGTSWCIDCARSRRYLAKHRIPCEFIDIDGDSEEEQWVLKVNRGARSVPTIVFPDGSILVEPSNRELGRKLGLREASFWDRIFR